MYLVVFHADVVLNREHELLDKAQQRAMLACLEQNPESQKRLNGPLRGCLRYRVADRRVVYSINENIKRV